MDKIDFLYELGQRLSGLPEDDIQRSLDYYSEMIDDCTEDGMTEEEAVARLGSVEETAQKIISEIPLTKLIRQRVKPRRTMRAWEIVLLILGAPLWLSLLAAAFAVILSVYAVLCAVVITLYAADLTVACGAPVGIAGLVAYIVAGNFPAALLMLGAGVACVGLAIFMFLGCNQVTRGVIALGRLILVGIKRCFVRKESAK